MTLQHTKIPHLSHHISRSWMPLGAVNCRHTDGEANPGPPANHGAWTQCNGNPDIVVMLALYCTLVMTYIYIILYYIHILITVAWMVGSHWGNPLIWNSLRSNKLPPPSPLQDIRSSAQAPNISGKHFRWHIWMPEVDLAVSMWESACAGSLSTSTS